MTLIDFEKKLDERLQKYFVPMNRGQKIACLMELAGLLTFATYWAFIGLDWWVVGFTLYVFGQALRSMSTPRPEEERQKAAPSIH